MNKHSKTTWLRSNNGCKDKTSFWLFKMSLSPAVGCTFHLSKLIILLSFLPKILSWEYSTRKPAAHHSMTAFTPLYAEIWTKVIHGVHLRCSSKPASLHSGNVARSFEACITAGQILRFEAKSPTYSTSSSRLKRSQPFRASSRQVSRIEALLLPPTVINWPLSGRAGRLAFV